MNLRALTWGLAFLLAGIAVGAAWLPGLDSWGFGPRIGAATLLVVFGLILAVGANVRSILRRTTRAEDYRGGCPVGATCKCGHFNFKPRKTCRQCGAGTSFS